MEAEATEATKILKDIEPFMVAAGYERCHSLPGYTDGVNFVRIEDVLRCSGDETEVGKLIANPHPLPANWKGDYY